MAVQDFGHYKAIKNGVTFLKLKTIFFFMFKITHQWDQCQF